MRTRFECQVSLDTHLHCCYVVSQNRECRAYLLSRETLGYWPSLRMRKCSFHHPKPVEEGFKEQAQKRTWHNAPRKVSPFTATAVESSWKHARFAAGKHICCAWFPSCSGEYALLATVRFTLPLLPLTPTRPVIDSDLVYPLWPVPSDLHIAATGNL